MSQGMIHLSGLCDEAWKRVHNNDGTWGSVLDRIDPVEWLINLACKAPISAYEYSRYGKITKPEQLIAILPPLAAPKTREEAETWNPDSLDAANAAAFEKWKKDSIAIIEADEEAGWYEPKGSLLDWFLENQGLVAAGIGVGLLGLIYITSKR